MKDIPETRQNKNQPNKNQKKRTRLNEKGEKREQHEFGDNLFFFSVDKLYIKNILTLLEKYIIGLSNIQTLIVKSIPQTRTYTSPLTFLDWYKHYNNIYIMK
jgi:hypothetical protein